MKLLAHAVFAALLAATPLPAGAQSPAHPSGKPVAELWQELLATGTTKGLMDRYEPVFAFNPAQEPDPALCRTHMAALAEGARAVPVAAALWYQAYRCAEVLGNDAEAESFHQGFEALAAHAFAGASVDNQAPPIRVLQLTDVDALVHATGLELIGQQVDLSLTDRYLPIRVTLFDADRNREHQFNFDMLDTWVRLSAGEPEAAYPFLRQSLTLGLIEGLVEDDTDLGRDVKAVIEASRNADVGAALQQLQAEAERGGLGSAATLLQMCISKRDPRCQGSLVDALLTGAEKRYASYRLMLAAAHGLGVGVDKDERAAEALAADAEKRLGGGRAYAAVVAIYLEHGRENEVPASLRRELADAARRPDSPMATIVQAALNIKLKTKVDPGVLKRLGEAAGSGLPSAMLVLGSLAQQARQGELARSWYLKAAGMGLVRAQFALAQLLADESQGVLDPEGARRWRREAGMGGHPRAIAEMALAHLEAREWPEAAGWLQSAAAAGNVPAGHRLAVLYLEGHKGVEGTPADAVGLFEELGSEHGHRPSRIALGTLLAEGAEGVDKDPTRARAILQAEAEQGDAEAQQRLGNAILMDLLVAREEGEGSAWLERAVAQDHAPAQFDLGTALYYGEKVPRDRRRGLELTGRAAKAGHPMAGNNLAWMLCTVPEAPLRDPVRGLATAEGLGDVAGLPPSWLDTLAACHAANGRFDSAARLQSEAIARLSEDASAQMRSNMQERLAGYNGKRPYVEVEPAPSDLDGQE